MTARHDTVAPASSATATTLTLNVSKGLECPEGSGLFLCNLEVVLLRFYPIFTRQALRCEV